VPKVYTVCLNSVVLQSVHRETLPWNHVFNHNLQRKSNHRSLNTLVLKNTGQSTSSMELLPVFTYPLVSNYNTKSNNNHNSLNYSMSMLLLNIYKHLYSAFSQNF